MSFSRSSRRSHTSAHQNSAQITVAAEKLETRQMLSGNSIANPQGVVDQAVTDHASDAAKKGVKNAESATTTATANATAEQTKLDKMKADAKADLDQKKSDADTAQQKADDAVEEQTQHEDKAEAERDAQQKAYDEIDEPAILRDPNSDTRPASELTDEELQDRRDRAVVYLHNIDINNRDGLTPWQEWGRAERQAQVHEVDAERARRDAEQKQKEADEKKEAFEAAETEWKEKLENQQTAVDSANQTLQAARTAEQAANDAAVTDATNNLNDAVATAEENLKTAKEKLVQKIRDVRKALHFARILGLTPDGFTAEKLKAWQDAMDELLEYVNTADDFDLLPETMADVIEIAASAIVGAITGLRTTRILQMEFEVDGIDLGNERNGMENATASDWLQDDNHDTEAADDDEQAIRMMRILLDWNRNGVDVKGCLKPAQDCVQAAEARLQQLQETQQKFECARTQLAASSLDKKLGLRKAPGGYYENWAGLNEKWMLSDDGWVFITPDGQVQQWFGGRGDNLQSQPVGQLDPAYHQNPSAAHDAQAIELDGVLQLRFNDSYYRNWGGQNEKWIQGSDSWYWLNETGQLYRWNGGSRSSLFADSTPVAEGLDEFFCDAARLHDAFDRAR